MIDMAYRVDGVTVAAAQHKARKQLGGASSNDDEKIIEETYNKMKPVQISDIFDAPQFCNDFIVLVEKTIKCRSLRVMVHTDKRNKQGALVTSKRTGKLLKSWQVYKG